MNPIGSDLLSIPKQRARLSLGEQTLISNMSKHEVLTPDEPGIHRLSHRDRLLIAAGQNLDAQR